MNTLDAKWARILIEKLFGGFLAIIVRGCWLIHQNQTTRTKPWNPRKEASSEAALAHGKLTISMANKFPKKLQGYAATTGSSGSTG